MEVIITAVMGEIANRSITFVVDRCSKSMSPAMETEEERLHRLQRLLLRVRVIVEEAEERHITNQAMLHLLSMARKEMYRGYYTLDNFRRQRGKDHRVSHRFALSECNPAKRLFLSNGDTESEKELQQVLNNLNNIIVDASELVSFLKNYPPLCRQPYSMQLHLDTCMFGRQMEMERVMNFLMPRNIEIESIGVLPIIGPAEVGKSTLVAHVSNNERVRNIFSTILLVSEGDLDNQILNNLNHGSLIKQKNNASGENGPVLVIVELPENVDDTTWKMIYSAYAGWIPRGSKIIITSRSSKIMHLGTTQALVLNSLPQEAFWYFFKVHTFGSADSDEQSKLASIAMEIVNVVGINRSFIGANLIASSLRANLDVRFWSKFLDFSKISVRRNISMFGEAPSSLMKKNKPVMFHRMVNGDCVVVHNQYETSSEREAPKITIQDVLFGSVKCQGRMEVLAWRSFIPPYKNRIYKCQIQKTRSKGSRKKAV